MKKVLLMAAAIVAAAPAFAEWVPVVETEDGRSAYYMDMSTVQRSGSLRRVWVVMNLETPEPSGIKSYKALEEYDCSERKSRPLQVQGYAGPMGSGSAIGPFSGAMNWLYHGPESIGLAMTQAVCRK